VCGCVVGVRWMGGSVRQGKREKRREDWARRVDWERRYSEHVHQSKYQVREYMHHTRQDSGYRSTSNRQLAEAGAGAAMEARQGKVQTVLAVHMHICCK
jgi:hypothetical protein